MPTGSARCPWPGVDPLYLAYHDEEWGAPEWDDRALFEKLVLDGFQAGLAWITILRKRPAFRAAFDGFDPERIARYDAAKVDGADRRSRHRAPPRQDRGDDRAGAGHARPARAGRPRASICGASSTAGRSTASANRSREVPRRDRRLAGDLEGPQGARRALRRADDRLRLHAGDRHGQRPPRRLPSPRRLPRARREPAVVSRAEPHKPRAWQRMLSGRRLDLIDPSPLDVEIADIAHGLARVARWNGQTRGPEIFSVAQHSLLVEAIFAAADAGAAARRPPRRAAARRAGIRDRRHDLAVQGGDRRRLQAGGEAAAGGDLRPLRPAARAAGRTRQGDQGGRPRSPPISRRRRSPASPSPRRASFSARRGSP